jgi:hypothetical protein
MSVVAITVVSPKCRQIAVVGEFGAERERGIGGERCSGTSTRGFVDDEIDVTIDSWRLI